MGLDQPLFFLMDGFIFRIYHTGHMTSGTILDMDSDHLHLGPDTW